MTSRSSAHLYENYRGCTVVSRRSLRVSSLMDTWISLRDIEADGERNRILYLLKSRGMSHSKQIREYELSDDGIHLTEPYLGPEGVLTGAARMAQEARGLLGTSASVPSSDRKHPGCCFARPRQHQLGDIPAGLY
jgi:hypothetical protein